MNVTISEEALNYGSFAALGSIAGRSKQTADDMAKNITSKKPNNILLSTVL